MARFNLFQRLFRRTAAPASGSGRSGGLRGFFQRVFGRRSQTPAPSKDATEFINQTISDKELQDYKKYNSFMQSHPDSNLTISEWRTMVTVMGDMSNTIEQYSKTSDPIVLLFDDMHDANLYFSAEDIEYMIEETSDLIKSTPGSVTQETAMDMLRERILYDNI